MNCHIGEKLMWFFASQPFLVRLAKRITDFAKRENSLDFAKRKAMKEWFVWEFIDMKKPR